MAEPMVVSFCNIFALDKLGCKPLVSDSSCSLDGRCILSEFRTFALKDETPPLASPDTDSRSHAGRQRLKTLLAVVSVCLMIVMIVRTLGPQTLGEQARRVFEKQLADHYQDWNVSVGRGLYRPGVGFQFDNIRLSPRLPQKNKRSASQSRAAMLTASVLQSWNSKPPVEVKRITVFADIDVQKLLDQVNPMTPRRVVFEGINVDVQLQSDGQLSLAGLWPPPQLGPVCPRIELRDVSVNVSADAKLAARANRLAPPTGVTRSHRADEQSLQFHLSEIVIDTQHEVAGTSNGKRKIAIRGDSDIFRSCSVDVSQIISHDELVQTHVKSTISDVRLTHELFERIETWLPRPIPADAQFRIAGDLNVQLQIGTKSDAKHPANPHSLDYDIDYIVRDGGYADKRLPDRFEQLRGRLRLTPQKIELFTTSARFGDATIRAAGSSDLEVALVGPDKTVSNYLNPLRQRSDVLSVSLADSRLMAKLSNCTVKVAADDLHLNDGLRRSLPPRSAVVFDRFRPSGRIDLTAQWSHRDPWNGQPWSIQANVLCKGVDVRFDKFPYPVKQLQGQIQIAGGRVETRQLTGVAGGRPIHCVFSVPQKTESEDDVPGARSIVIRSDGAIAIDNELISALSPRDGPSQGGDMPLLEASKLEQFVRSLKPRGAIELASAAITTDSAGVTSRQIDLRVIGGTLRYENFSYPLYNVEGRVKVENDLVRLIGFSASNAGAAKIGCDGLYQMPTPQSASELNLRFRVADLALDHSLKGSLPESSRSVWEALTPAGTLDKLDVQIRQIGHHPITLSLDASHQTEARANPNPLSIRPKAIPYRVDIVGGKVGFHDGVVQIEQLRGRHDASRLIADGVCQAQPSGQWLLTMDMQSGCRLIPDDELIAALPEQMGWAMRSLDLRGPLGVRGVTSILLAQNETDSPVINWDLAVQLEGNRIADVGPVHSLRGEIMVRGIKDGELLRAGGEIAVDSLHAYGLQVTALRGPFSILGEELRLGTLASSVDPASGLPLSTNGLHPLTDATGAPAPRKLRYRARCLMASSTSAAWWLCRAAISTLGCRWRMLKLPRFFRRWGRHGRGLPVALI